jgi:hypothetical protein
LISLSDSNVYVNVAHSDLKAILLNIKSESNVYGMLHSDLKDILLNI